MEATASVAVWVACGRLSHVPSQPALLNGLTAAEVAQRVAQGKQNDLPPRSGRTVGGIVRANVFTRINAILTVLLVIVLATGSWINAAFGLLIIANSIIGIVQELRAKQTLDGLAVVGEARPLVRRDGVSVAIGRGEVVQDDLIELGPGDQIVVDGEIVAASYLEIDESLLTGESDPVTKEVGDEVQSGSFVVAGTGTYRATRVGAAAYAAQLTAQAAKFSLVHSELQSGINKILKVITWLLVPVGLLTIWTQLSQPGVAWRDAVLRMAGALVPMVPEGLVLLTSMAFALGVIRLGRRKCLVQELPAIEGLARVDVVCADKTGTLTENGMRFSELVCLGDTEDNVRETLRQLAGADPRPNASLQAVADEVRRPDRPWPLLARAPFTSAKKWSGATFAGPGNWVLGAPDVLAAEESPAGQRAQQIADTGQRVLLLGHSTTPVDDPAAPGVVVPTALVVLAQRVRPDARETLEFFASQRVEVKVISGDNAKSVAAVTSELGVGETDPVDARGLTDPARLAAAVATRRVFGRVTPVQKRAMVKALQSEGRVVAMTGDGVNDVLALKDADLGVAMGSGAAATRSVAKIVLLDDRFATLPYVVAEGRRVIGNIERVANLFLTKTVYSALLALLVVLARVPFPFQPIHVTITGWFTIGIPAFLLSLAPNNERARPGFASRVLRLGLPAGVLVALVTFTAFLIARQMTTPARASTAALAALIVAATWVLAVVARPYQWWKLGLLAAAAGAYLAIFTWPLTQGLFLLDVGDAAAMNTGLMIGFAGAVCVEIAWWVGGIIHREPRRLWLAPGDQPATPPPEDSAPEPAQG